MTALGAAGPAPPLLARARFALARALPPASHARARQLAHDAAAAYRSADEAAPLAAVEAWLRAHP